MARGLARVGTTAFLPTLFPKPPEQLGADLERLAPTLGSFDGGAEALGFHLEGPFLNPAAAGALPVDQFAQPSPEALRTLLGPAMGAGRGVRTITLAPELSGAGELIAELARCGIRASLGHSLATAAEARTAARAGAVGATHLFNAMRPWHHREVGLAGFALTDDALSAEIIGDLTHVSAEAFALALDARGATGLCLVSDALPGAGTGCEVFHFRGHSHVVRRGAAFYGDAETPEDEAPLAGSATSQLDALRGLVAAGVVTLEEGLALVGEGPALALGLERERGVLVEGARADLIVLEPGSLALRETWVGGACLRS